LRQQRQYRRFNGTIKKMVSRQTRLSTIFAEFC
jgi:hypothetical protein